MAESASTGNSGTGTTSTSTSNSGAAAPGSQSSSNGSFSTGNGNGGSNGGTGPGLSFGAGVGAVNGPSTGLPSFNNGKSGFTGFASSNFGQGWGPATHTISPGADGKHTVHPDANGKHTVYATTESDRSGSTIKQLTVPVMTVDEVYGKGNQSMVESQGDYEASSNEKSNVETSTFGKQDEISVTPLSVTEDKGLVNNDAIQSVEGLDFQQKDKANQDVMEAKKSRDDAEAEDNANGMRDSLKAANEKGEEETETDAFKVGESEAEKAYNDEDAAWQQNLQEQKAQIDAYKQSIENTKAVVAHYEGMMAKGKTGIKPDLESAKTELAYDTKTLEALQASYDEMEQSYNGWKDDSKSRVEKGEMVEALAAKAKEKADKAFKVAQKEREYAVAKQWYDMTKESIAREVVDAVETLTTARPGSNEYNQAVYTLQGINNVHIGVFRGDRRAYKNPGKMLEAINNYYDAQTARFQKAYEEIANSKESEETKAKAIETVNSVKANAKSLEDAANALASNLNDPTSIETYVNNVKAYNEGLKNALNDKELTKTDFNKAFTEMVAKANDFDVTLPDGTKKGFAEFAAEMAVRSPEIAKGLYEAKAKNYEENGHKVLAAIENAKSKMVMTWLGSKLTFADNQVRSQFNQMAKTDMRATYAAYNNILNDETGKYSEAEKAEASAAIEQANSLMTASAALQASTGFLSGIGDSMSDGVYGVTDPGKLNGYQEALNTASNFAKIALGLGVTPGANEAYQNMYYMAGAKVNQSGLFGRDFDGDGFALCQEYGNNAAVGMIAGAGELATGVALMFNPATSKLGINLAIDSVQTFLDGLYGVQKEANKSIKYSNEILKYFGEAKNIAAETGNKEVINTMSTAMDNAVKQIEDFQLKSDEVGSLDNWLEGSGSNTADNGKFNQALSYDEWLKLIEADPVMQEYAKSLNK